MTPFKHYVSTTVTKVPTFFQIPSVHRLPGEKYTSQIVSLMEDRQREERETNQVVNEGYHGYTPHKMSLMGSSAKRDLLKSSVHVRR